MLPPSDLFTVDSFPLILKTRVERIIVFFKDKETEGGIKWLKVKKDLKTSWAAVEYLTS